MKVRIIAHPLPTTPTTSAPMNPIPTPTVATSIASSQMFMVKLAATSILVTVYNLVQGKFKGIAYTTGRPKDEKKPSTPNCSSLQPEATPNVLSLPG